MPIRLLSIFALVAACVAMGVYANSARTTSAAVSPGCSVDPSIDAEEQAFLGIINQYRQQNGRGPLKLSTTLNKAASWKSFDMANNNYVAHDDTPSGRSWVDRIRDCGYTYNAWIGENIAVGNSSAQITFNQWKGSPPHNDNMLSSNYTAIGIGRAYNAGSTHGWYWTTDFASYSDGYSVPVPTPTATPRPPTPTPNPSQTSQPPASEPCADFTGDGHVAVEDILVVVSRYRSNDDAADLDNNGIVNVLDIMIVIRQYGADC